MSESDSEIENTPPECRKLADETKKNLLPDKSQHRYVKEYEILDF